MNVAPTKPELLAILQAVDGGKNAERVCNSIFRNFGRWDGEDFEFDWDAVLDATDSELLGLINFGVGSLRLWRKAFPARKFDPPPPPPQPNERDRAIVEMRRESHTYEDIAYHFVVTRERVAQILKRWAPELRGRLKVSA